MSNEIYYYTKQVHTVSTGTTTPEPTRPSLPQTQTSKLQKLKCELLENSDTWLPCPKPTAEACNSNRPFRLLNRRSKVNKTNNSVRFQYGISIQVKSNPQNLIQNWLINQKTGSNSIELPRTKFIEDKPRPEQKGKNPSDRAQC